jgi:predicted metal-dependent HD superfamily phosphohydrolase
MDKDLLEKASSFVTSLLPSKDSETFFYHNLRHTRQVVKSTKEIATGEGLDEDTMEMLLLAAWFHDTGYITDKDNHEAKSAEIARDFLQTFGYDATKIARISAAILATKMPQSPANLAEQVLCDADLAGLGSDRYEKNDERMRQELLAVSQKESTDEEWLTGTISFLQSHRYFTNYANTHFAPVKAANLLKQQAALEGLKPKTPELEKEIKKLKEKLAVEQQKQAKYSRGVETMFRTTSHNHLELSNMADHKANIMISVNSIIISLIVSVLSRKLTEYPNLVIPTVILMLVCTATIVFAILGTRPQVTSGRFDKSLIQQSKTNLLFFGNFHSMTLEDYEWGVNELIKDDRLLYNSMIQDIFYLGKVLGKKYRLIRISYTIFMYGFVIAILAFAIAVMFFPEKPIA